MNLYIETENGVIKNHPALEENLIDAFGLVPAHWVPFIRVERPTPSVYQAMDSIEPVYAQVAGVWADVWSLRDMTVAEKSAKQQATKDVWAARPQAYNFTTWIFDEATCAYQPPIPRPASAEGKDFRWRGVDNNWREFPARPEGGYKFDSVAWAWVAI